MAPQDEIDLSEVKVLIVDDNAFMLRLICSLARSIGCRNIKLADDGTTAVEHLKAGSVDVILSDWQMPRMHGREFVQWVRRSPESPVPDVPILLITGANQEKEILEARDAGIDIFITKPVTAGAIEKRLRKALQGGTTFVRRADYAGPCRRRSDGGEYSGPERRQATKEHAPAGGSVDQFVANMVFSIRELRARLETVCWSDEKQVEAAAQNLRDLSRLARMSGGQDVHDVAAAIATSIETLHDPNEEEKRSILEALRELEDLTAQSHNGADSKAQAQAARRLLG